MTVYIHFRYSLLTLCLVLCVRVFAQRQTDRGDRYFNQNQFETAIKYYLMDAGSKNKKAADKALQKLADSYRIIGEFDKAEDCYRKILKKKKKDPANYLNYALSLKSSAKYAEAKLQFAEYIRLKPEDPMGQVYLQSCDSAQLWLDQTIGKEARNLEKINTGFSEFSPVISGRSLYFSSSRPGSTQALVSFDGGGELHRLDIYSISFDHLAGRETVAGDVLNFREINTPRHEGAASFSQDGREVYFTRTVKGQRDEKTNDVLNTLQVFYSKIDSTGHWTRPQSAFSFNSHKYSVAQPSLSPDGKTIYFMSDMPGGLGKTDIYYAVKQANGNWSAPKNLGNHVNTFGYEMFPYISASGTLYFSSNAHPGMGQLDIFRASYIQGKWTNVSNMKPPLNSIGNDFGIALDGSDHQGFFSSDRFNGNGAEDIYSFSDELPLELSIAGDTLSFPDRSIYDELSYKLVNEDDKSETELRPLNGQYLVLLDRSVPYKLSVRKNGLSYNKIYIVNNSLHSDIDLDIRSASKPVSIKGRLVLTPDSVLRLVRMLKMDTLGSQSQVIISSRREYRVDTLRPGLEVVIKTLMPPTFKMDEDSLAGMQANAMHLKGRVTDQDHPVENASIFLKQGGAEIVLRNTNKNGEFDGYVVLSDVSQCVLEVSKEGYQTKQEVLKPSGHHLPKELTVNLRTK